MFRTASEIATQIERMRADRMARRIIDRFDANRDGVLTKAEIEARQKIMFALMDRNEWSALFLNASSMRHAA